MCSFEGIIILDSSMVEHTAVNRGVVGSSPTRGVPIKSLLISLCFLNMRFTLVAFFFRKVGLQSNIKYVTIFDVRVFIIIVYGSLVKRLRHRPFTAVTRVRFP